MDALVAQIAVAGGPNPMPIIVEAFAHQRVFGCRAAPEVVIYFGRNRLGAGHFADAGAALVTKTAGAKDFANLSLANPFDAFEDAAAGTALRSGLDDAIIFAGGDDELAAFPDFVGHRLFDVNVFAGLDGPDGAERMPVVWRGKSDHINILVLEQFADVGISFDFLAAVAGVFDFAVEDV